MIRIWIWINVSWNILVRLNEYLKIFKPALFFSLYSILSWQKRPNHSHDTVPLEWLLKSAHFLVSKGVLWANPLSLHPLPRVNRSWILPPLHANYPSEQFFQIYVVTSKVFQHFCRHLGRGDVLAGIVFHFRRATGPLAPLAIKK